MNEMPMCEDKSGLVAYLYGECSADERRAVEAHVAVCAACRTELEGLRDLRGQLAEWTPPEEILGFRVVSGEATPSVPPRPWWRTPAWGLAAAAVLVLAVAAAIARVEVRYDAAGLVVRTGWGAGAFAGDGAARPVVPASVATQGGAAAEAPWRSDLRALETSLRRDLAPAPAVAPAATSDEVLREVRALIEASESRQQRELALRFAQFSRDVDQQRRADLVRIQAGFGRLEDLTGVGVAQQREVLNYMMRVSGRER